MEKLKILVVDDEPHARLLLETIIKTYCKEIFYAKNGFEAVECARSNSDIDLILMDKKMPEMDGYEATRLIRQFNSDVRIIALSASHLETEKEHSIDAGSNDFLYKPVDIDLLTQLIEEFFLHR
jgi:CheY-like chemotaxis protein